MTDLADVPLDLAVATRQREHMASPCSIRSVTEGEASRTDHRFDDAELTAQAMAATGADTAEPDALNYWDLVEPVRTGLLPDWYMPTPSAGTRRLSGWRRHVVFLVVFAIGAINAAGLCITYGHVTLG